MTALTVVMWLMIAIVLFVGLMYVQMSFGKPAKQKISKLDLWTIILICLLWPSAIVFIVADAGVEKLTDWVNK